MFPGVVVDVITVGVIDVSGTVIFVDVMVLVTVVEVIVINIVAVVDAFVLVFKLVHPFVVIGFVTDAFLRSSALNAIFICALSVLTVY